MTRQPKKKLKHLQRRLSEVELLMRKYTYPPIYERQQMHPSVPLCLVQNRDELLRQLRKVQREILKRRRRLLDKVVAFVTGDWG